MDPRLPKPLLWVPSARKEGSDGERVGHPYVGVVLGYEELWGRPSTWSKVTRRLARYSMEDLLDVLSRFSGALWHGRSKRFGETQSKACLGLFGVEHGNRVISRAAECEKGLQSEGHTGPTVLFHDTQLQNLLKAALWSVTDRSESRGDHLSCLGEALLMTNNLLDQGRHSLEGVDIETPEGQEAWHLYMVANSLAQHTANPLHAMARSFHLYFEDRLNLREHPLYVDLPARLKEATGLVPEQLWSVLFGLLSYWSVFEIDQVSAKPGSIQRSTYLTSKYDFTEDESDLFFDFLTIGVQDLASQVQKRYSREAIKQFDMLPLAVKPLVQLGDRVYCPSYPLLLQKLSVGLHHLHLDPDLFPDPDERKRYLDYTGVVFEDYVHTLLLETYPPLSGRYVPGEELVTSKQRPKSCDGLLLYGSRVVVFEVKATLLTVDARSGSDWEAYLGKVQDIVVDAIDQLYATIDRLESGDLVVPGLPRDGVTFLPVIVTLEPLVMNRFVYRELDRIAGEHGLSASARTRPWQLLHVEELEVACLGVDQGRSIADLLAEKTSSPDSVGESFVNYCHSKREPFLTAGHHPMLAGIFDRLGRQVVDWLASKSKDVEPLGETGTT